MKNVLGFIAGLIIIAFCSCKSETEHIEVVQFRPERNDSLLLIEIMNKDLLFDMSYALVDAKMDLDRFDWAVNSKNLLSTLIGKDSTLEDPYQVLSNIKNRIWKTSTQYTFISDSLYNDIFEDSYLLGGAVDNYKTLRQTTSTDGVLEVSDISYSIDGQSAFMFLAIHCDWSCGQTQLRLYQKNNSLWKLKKKYVLSES